MKSLLASAALLAALVSTSPLRAEAACACCTAPAPTTTATTTAAGAEAEPAAPVGHPLRGVVVAVLADKQALLVKHEEIPGVMRAMTMLLKVDAAALAAAKKDQAITATLIRKTDGWWLEDVKPAATPPAITPPAPAPTR